MSNVIKFPQPKALVGTEEVAVRGCMVEITLTAPDGDKFTRRLTPDEAIEWSEVIADAAADAMTEANQ